jgi:hypothetical protein
MRPKNKMAKPKRGPSAYNTPYDEFPDDLSLLPPYSWIFLLEIMLLMLGGAILTSMIADNYFPSFHALGFIGIVFASFCISTPNFMIAYGYNKGVIPIQLLSLLYIVGAIPHFFFEYPLFSLIPMVSGILVFWITTTTKFKILVYDRKKMGIWRREQLEKK